MEKAHLHSCAKLTNFLKIDKENPTVLYFFLSLSFSRLAVIFQVSLRFYSSYLADGTQSDFHHKSSLSTRYLKWCWKKKPTWSLASSCISPIAFVLKDRVGLHALIDRVGQLNWVVKERQSLIFIFLLLLHFSFLHLLLFNDTWLSRLCLANSCEYYIAKNDNKHWENLVQSAHHIDLLQFYQEIIKTASYSTYILLSYPTFPVQDATGTLVTLHTL